jgi:hypothetical protein
LAVRFAGFGADSRRLLRKLARSARALRARALLSRSRASDAPLASFDHLHPSKIVEYI